MPRTLVVFHSRSDHTRRVAEAIARDCGGDLQALEPVQPMGLAASAFKAWLGIAVPIRPLAHDPAAYDRVVIGTPVWVGHVTPPVRRFLDEHRVALAAVPSVAFFCTYGGSSSARVLREMGRLSGREPAATLAVREADIDAQRHGPAVEGFMHALSLAPSRGPAPREPQDAQGAPRQRHA